MKESGVARYTRTMLLASLLALCRPSFAARLSQIRLYGLMVTRSDYWTMQTWLAVHAWQFECLAVLDGTADADLALRIQTATRLYDNVVYKHEQNYTIQRPITDNAVRGIAWSLFPNDTDLLGAWIVVAHPDEFYLQRFSDMAIKAEAEGANALSMKTLYALPYSKDKTHLEEGIQGGTQSFNILYRVRYCVSDLFYSEDRMFKYETQDIRWGERHMYTLPEHFPGLKKAAWSGWYLHYKIHNFDHDAVASDGSQAHSAWSHVHTSSSGRVTNMYTQLEESPAQLCAVMVHDVCTSLDPPCRMYVL